jgi:predicted ATPase
MLHRLEIANFYSIREPHVIDLRAAADAPDSDGRLAPLWRGCAERGPRVVALFGANGSGKSNLLTAVSFIAWLLRHSFDAPRGARLPFERFNDTDMADAPTRLAVHLSGPEEIGRADDPDAAACRYGYECTIGGGAQPRIEAETLRYWPSQAGRRGVRLFARDAAGRVSAAAAFGLAGYRPALEMVLRPEASLIATLAQWDHPFARLLSDTADRVLSNIMIDRRAASDDSAVRYYAANPRLIEHLNRDIERMDLGIRAMHVLPGDHGPVAVFTHAGLAWDMPLMLESHGTRQFIKLYPLILHALETGGVVVLDELDATMHPRLLPEILRWFHDPARNPLDAQLWMSCHNAALLDELRQEEVLLCEKDSLGRSRVCGLRDVEAVRLPDNYYRKYLAGALGAVPRIG